MLATSVMETLGKTGHLYIKYFLARCRHIAGLWDKWQSLHWMKQSEVGAGHNRLGTNDICLAMALGIDEGSVGTALCPDAVDVDLLYLQLRLERESLCLGKHFAILDDDGISAIYYILSALAKST